MDLQRLGDKKFAPKKANPSTTDPTPQTFPSEFLPAQTRENPVAKSATKSGGSNMKVRVKSGLPENGPNNWHSKQTCERPKSGQVAMKLRPATPLPHHVTCKVLAKVPVPCTCEPQCLFDILRKQHTPKSGHDLLKLQANVHPRKRAPDDQFLSVVPVPR